MQIGLNIVIKTINKRFLLKSKVAFTEQLLCNNETLWN